jgi:hypothetical protein
MRTRIVPLLALTALLFGCKSGDTASTAPDTAKSADTTASTTPSTTGDATATTGTAGTDASTAAPKPTTTTTTTPTSKAGNTADAKPDSAAPPTTPAPKPDAATPATSAGPSYSIVGTWTADDVNQGAITVEFKSDGTAAGQMVNPKDKTMMQFSANYKAENGKLDMKPTMLKVIPGPNADDKIKQQAAAANAMSAKITKDAKTQTDKISWKDKDTFEDTDSSGKVVTFKRKS